MHRWASSTVGIGLSSAATVRDGAGAFILQLPPLIGRGLLPGVLSLQHAQPAHTESGRAFRWTFCGKSSWVQGASAAGLSWGTSGACYRHPGFGKQWPPVTLVEPSVVIKISPELPVCLGAERREGSRCWERAALHG